MAERQRRRVRAGVRRRKSFGPVDVHLTHRGVSSVTIDPPGPGSYNTRTGDISFRGPFGGWLKIATGARVRDGKIPWRQLLRILGLATLVLVLVGTLAVGGGYAAWRVYGDDVRASVCERTGVLCPAPAAAPEATR